MIKVDKLYDHWQSQKIDLESHDSVALQFLQVSKLSRGVVVKLEMDKVHFVFVVAHEEGRKEEGKEQKMD